MAQSNQAGTTHSIAPTLASLRSVLCACGPTVLPMTWISDQLEQAPDLVCMGSRERMGVHEPNPVYRLDPDTLSVWGS